MLSGIKDDTNEEIKVETDSEELENDRPCFISFHVLFHRCYVMLCYIICTRIEVAPLLRSQT